MKLSTSFSKSPHEFQEEKYINLVLMFIKSISNININITNKRQSKITYLILSYRVITGHNFRGNFYIKGPRGRACSLGHFQHRNTFC